MNRELRGIFNTSYSKEEMSSYISTYIFSSYVTIYISSHLARV